MGVDILGCSRTLSERLTAEVFIVFLDLFESKTVFGDRIQPAS
jgi:hypothetical protein